MPQIFNIGLKPIFHWERRLCWLPNTNEVDTNNMKSTCPTQDFCVGDQTQPIFHWLALGFCVRANANFMFCVRSDANLVFILWQKTENFLDFLSTLISTFHKIKMKT